MSDNPSAEQLNAQAAQKYQLKFDFYAVALTFTTLAFSVETVHFGRGVASDVAEYVAWAALLVSGLSGLSRLSWASQVLFAHSARVGVQEYLTKVKRGVAEGKDAILTPLGDSTLPPTMPSALFIQSAEQSLKKSAAAIDWMEKRQDTRFQFQFRGFVVGVLSLVVARGLPHFVKLLGYVLR